MLDWAPPASWCCGFCGESNPVVLDLSSGQAQSYIEDCQVCCRPNRLEIRVDPEQGSFRLEARYEG